MARPLYNRRAPRRARRVLLVLLSGAGNLSGFVISQAAQTGAGTVYPVLARLEREGWVTSDWESPEPADRPRRRFYKLSEEGRVQAMRLLRLEAPDA
jgi:DNA-binding PadR family transcriptional regulator